MIAANLRQKIDGCGGLDVGKLSTVKCFFGVAPCHCSLRSLRHESFFRTYWILQADRDPQPDLKLPHRLPVTEHRLFGAQESREWVHMSCSWIRLSDFALKLWLTWPPFPPCKSPLGASATTAMSMVLTDSASCNNLWPTVHPPYRQILGSLRVAYETSNELRVDFKPTRERDTEEEDEETAWNSCDAVRTIIADSALTRGVHYTKHVRVYVNAQKGY